MSTTTLQPWRSTRPWTRSFAENEGRKPELLRRKYRRMGEDLFAFFRGTDHLFAAAWEGLAPVDPGPAILICGDLHLENFGAYRADDGDFVFDINDFDERWSALARST